MEEDQKYKADKGKPKLGMLLYFPRALEEVGKAAEHGADKYGENTWPKVNKGRYIHAAMRHLIAAAKGNFLFSSVDHESKLPHIAHVILNLLMALELDLRELEGKHEP